MKNIAIFISAGRNENLASNVIKYHNDYFDSYINIYEPFVNQKYVENNATKCFYLPTTKFIALKQIYYQYLINYDIVFVFDDDGIITKGSIRDLSSYIYDHNLDIISPAQDINGKISKNIDKVTKFHSGDHRYRIVNFIEMNFPVFKNSALKKYLDIYDGKLCGYGNDWWYLNVLDANNAECCAITDRVIIFNPDFHQKNIPFPNNDAKISDIDNYMSKKFRKKQWELTAINYQLKTWEIKNLRFVD